MFPSPAQVHQAIACAREASWFIPQCSGLNCSRSIYSQQCRHIVAWQTVGIDKREPIKHSIEAQLSLAGVNGCCVCTRPEFLPDAQTAPLIYVKHTSVQQAAILLHFGLLTERDVSKLIRKDFSVARLVAHLMHSGMKSRLLHRSISFPHFVP